MELSSTADSCPRCAAALAGDGVDDDCGGSIDNDFLVSTSSCGAVEQSACGADSNLIADNSTVEGSDWQH